MLLTTNEINEKYRQGIGYITNITFNKFLKDQYAVQYKKTLKDNHLLMLLYAVDSWDNRQGVTDNWLTQIQLMAILDNIGYGDQDSLSSITTTTQVSSCGCEESNGLSLSVADTESVQLSYVNGKLKANLKTSNFSNNGLSIKTDGAFSEKSSGGNTVTKIFIKSTDFVAGTNIYNNVALANKTNLTVWYRGLGLLLYNFNAPTDPLNEYRILSTGGIEIIIPGFDVHSGDNYFYIES